MLYGTMSRLVQIETCFFGIIHCTLYRLQMDRRTEKVERIQFKISIENNFIMVLYQNDLAFQSLINIYYS